jgi:hypothetical protein
MKTMKITKYNHKNSDKIKFERVERPDGYWFERTYDEKGNQLTFKDSDGEYHDLTWLIQ